MDEMTMLFAFPDGSASFVNGFEAGMIWQRIENGEALVDCGFNEGTPVHSENLDLIARMAASRGYTVEQKPSEVGWTSVRLFVSAKPRPSLSVVQP